MQYEKSQLIEYRIIELLRRLKTQNSLLKMNVYNLAANRIYYAIYYIVSALALKNDFFDIKHNQLLGWFNRNFVKTNIVSKDLGKFIIMHLIRDRRVIIKIWLPLIKSISRLNSMK